MFQIRLKELREKSGMSQAALAKELGVVQSTVGMWESGKNKPENAKLEALANIFQVSTDYLLGRTDTPDALKSPTVSVAAKPYRRIPVLGSIPVGVHIEAVEDVEDWEDLPESMFKSGAEYFALKVKGDSMSPKYEDGDVLILRRQGTCDNGQDCAVLVNGDDATFKRVRLSERGITLQPLNPKYDPIFYTNQEGRELPIRILGVVVELRRRIQ